MSLNHLNLYSSGTSVTPDLMNSENFVDDYFAHNGVALDEHLP